MDASNRQEIALFRYQVTAPLVTQNLTRVQYGLLLHEPPRQEFNQGDVGERQLGRRTIQRWVQAYRQKGLEGLERLFGRTSPPSRWSPRPSSTKRLPCAVRCPAEA